MLLSQHVRGGEPRKNTRNVDDAPWFSLEQVPSFFQEKFGEGDFARSFSLPEYGVFALRADTFQQYFAGYGWVS